MRRNTGWILVLLFSLVLFFAACGSGSWSGTESGSAPESGSDPHTMTGSETVTDSGTVTDPGTGEETGAGTAVPPAQTGINLFSGKLEWGTLSSDGKEVSSVDALRSGMIPVKPTTIYTLSTKNPSGAFVTSEIREYDKDGQCTNRTFGHTSIYPTTFCTRQNTAYIRFCTLENEEMSMELAEYTEYWLEEGRKSTPWEARLATFQKDQPENDGVRNALARAAYYCDYTLTTAGDGMKTGFPNPLSVGSSDKYITEVLSKGDLLLSFPYSSVRKTDTYIGYEVSIDTFLSAVQNPASILYTSNYQDPEDPGYTASIKYAWQPYGSVCSVIVGYALNLGIRYTTYEWETIPGMVRVDPATEDIRLCDVIDNVTSQDVSGGHMLMVTGIWREDDGKIRCVELTEAGVPNMCHTYMNGSYFMNTFLKSYQVYRYDRISEVPPPTSKYLSGEQAYPSVLCPDRGDEAVYPFGAAVELAVFEETAQTLIVERTDLPEPRVIAELPVSEIAFREINGAAYRIFALTPDSCGKYRAFCRMADGSECQAVFFHVADAGDFRYDTGAAGVTLPAGTPVAVLFDNYRNVKPLYICIETKTYVTRSQRYLTDEEIRCGSATVSYDRTGNYWVKIYYENEFGRITSTRLRLTYQ